jgi:SulP family sulfate permease
MNKVLELLPITSWLRGYQRSYWRADIISGVTSATIVIPKAMACAAIGGLPIEVGLYTAFVATLVYPFLGSSRPLSVSTTTAIAILTGAEIVAIVSTDTNISPTAIASTLALLVGALLVLAHFLRLGFLANFISMPVLIGFETGVGIVILIGQLKYFLGIQLASKTTIGTLLELSGLLTQLHAPTFLVGLAGILVLLGTARLCPKIPGAVIWIVASVSASAA